MRLLLPLPVSACAALAACTVLPPTAAPPSVRIDSVATGTPHRLIGLDAAGAHVWAAGARGAWARSSDGGRTWTTGTVAGADTLQFRDVHAVDGRRAVLLAIGPGTASRLYTTDDAGATWALRWTNADARAFYDCMAFDGPHGLAFSDAVTYDDGRTLLPLLETTDGGRSWRDVTRARTLETMPGTGAFASSGTCAVRYGGQWLLAYNRPETSAPKARVAAWSGLGPWRETTLPVASPDPMRGVATLAAHGETLYAGLLGAVDGRTVYRHDGLRAGRVATSGAAAAWVPLPPLPIGRVYGLAASPAALVATGPDGLAVSLTAGRTWTRLTTFDLWSAARVDDRTFVAVGKDGRAFRVTLAR